MVAFNEASNYAIEALKLPVTNVLAGVRSSDFYAPGSLLRVELDRANPLTAGYTAPEQAVWFEGSPAFDITDATRATAVARYPASGDPLMSGWLLGAPKLAGKAAMVDVKRGQGHVVLFGFRPQYRAQTMATYPLLWNALRGVPPGVCAAKDLLFGSFAPTVGRASYSFRRQLRALLTPPQSSTKRFFITRFSMIEFHRFSMKNSIIR